MGINKNQNNGIYWVFAAMVLVFVLIFVKLNYIQFKEGKQWRAKADSLQVQSEKIPASRGNIYSSDGSLLATSIPKYTIYFDPMASSKENFEKHIKGLSDSLAKYLKSKNSHQWESFFRKARANKSRYIHIATKLSYTTYTTFKKFPLFSLGQNKGGFIKNQVSVREYPMGMVANRTIGYERKSTEGKVIKKGIEAAYTKELSGKNGARMVQKMSKGLWKPIGSQADVDPVDGYDIITTIDVYIQDIAHHALLEALIQYQADHGTVVVMETKTGHIKAISNLGRTQLGTYFETINYALTERHDPGSTFKLASYLALLDDKKLDTASVIDTHNGIVTFSNRQVRDSNRRGYGQISLARGFEVSSNTVVTQAVNNAYKDNPSKFIDKLESFGFNKSLGLDLIGESKSLIPRPGSKQWSKIALPWMAYGYGILVTPLQMLTLYNAVANDGKLVKPQFVKEIRDVNQTIRTIDTQVLNPQIAKPEVIAQMQDILKNVVKKGTGKKLYSPYFSMAGKTGTAQMNYGKKDGGMYYASSFAGYFPAENPKYSCIVVIHKPTKGSYYGADVAGPVFKRLAQKIFTDVPSVKEVNSIEKPLKTSVASFNKFEQKVKKFNTLMPDVKRMYPMDAIALLENLGAQVETIGYGKVYYQSVVAGTNLTENQKIILELR